VLAVTGTVAAFALMAVIVVQSIALHDQKERTEAAREEAEWYRQSLEVAEEEAKRLQADLAEDERQSSDML